MTYIIEKQQDEVPQMKNPVVYAIKYTKVAKEVDGKEVTVIDENRTEQVTKEQLEAQKVIYQNAIAEIDKKLDTISKL